MKNATNNQKSIMRWRNVPTNILTYIQLSYEIQIVTNHSELRAFMDIFIKVNFQMSKNGRNMSSLFSAEIFINCTCIAWVLLNYCNRCEKDRIQWFPGWNNCWLEFQIISDFRVQFFRLYHIRKIRYFDRRLYEVIEEGWRQYLHPIFMSDMCFHCNTAFRNKCLGRRSATFPFTLAFSSPSPYRIFLFAVKSKTMKYSFLVIVLSIQNVL